MDNWAEPDRLRLSTAITVRRLAPGRTGTLAEKAIGVDWPAGDGVQSAGPVWP